MAINSGIKINIISTTLVVSGIFLVIWGYQLSESFGSQVSQVVTGTDTDKVVTIYLAGAVSLAIGIYLFIKR